MDHLPLIHSVFNGTDGDVDSALDEFFTDWDGTITLGEVKDCGHQVCACTIHVT